MVARWLPGTMESDDNSPQGATLRKVFEHGVISFFFPSFFFLFVCTYGLFTGRWIPLAKLIAFICQCAYSSIKETTVTYAWARYSQWYSLGKGYSRRSLHFLALIWMFGTRHNENSIVRESKQRKGSLDNFSFRMVFIFFLRSTNFENRDLSSKQTINCVERVFAHYRYIALDFYYRYVYIYRRYMYIS